MTSSQQSSIPSFLEFCRDLVVSHVVPVPSTDGEPRRVIVPGSNTSYVADPQRRQYAFGSTAHPTSQLTDVPMKLPWVMPDGRHPPASQNPVNVSHEIGGQMAVRLQHRGMAPPFIAEQTNPPDACHRLGTAGTDRGGHHAGTGRLAPGVPRHAPPLPSQPGATGRLHGLTAPEALRTALDGKPVMKAA